jgi:heme-degrading monooxygenase HmoA
MVRVTYTWQLEPGQEERFQTLWSEITLQMRRLRQGACGSLLLRSAEAPHRYLAVARWRSYDDWRASRQQPSVTPEATAQIQQCGQLLSIDVYDELVDFTYDPSAETVKIG